MRPTHLAALSALLCLYVASAAPTVDAGVRPPVPPARVEGEAAVRQSLVAHQAEVAQHETESGPTPVGDMGMQMVFFASNKFQLWFKSFNISSAGELTAACLGVVAMAALYEGLKVGRIILAGKIDSAGLASKGHWLQTFLHMTQVAVSYFLMLAVMTYSTWMMMSVCGGAALGYLVFARYVPTRSLLGNASEHCH